jgi:hypothetical protein
MSILRKIDLVQHVKQEIMWNKSSKQECNDDVKTTGAVTYVSL